MGIDKNIYFFGQTPLEGVDHIPLQETLFINPHCDFSNYDYIIVTSKRSIKTMHSFGYDFQQLPIYCIGKKTANYAKKQNLHVVHVSKGYAKDLIREIQPMIEGLKGLYLRPKRVANSYITDEVQKGSLDQAICYETLCVKNVNTPIVHPAVFLFAAPSQVKCFMQDYRFEEGDRVVVIGTTTLKAVPLGVECSVCDEASLVSLVAKGLAVSQ